MSGLETHPAVGTGRKETTYLLCQICKQHDIMKHIAKKIDGPLVTWSRNWSAGPFGFLSKGLLFLLCDTTTYEMEPFLREVKWQNISRTSSGAESKNCFCWGLMYSYNISHCRGIGGILFATIYSKLGNAHCSPYVQPPSFVVSTTSLPRVLAFIGCSKGSDFFPFFLVLICTQLQGRKYAPKLLER